MPWQMQYLYRGFALQNFSLMPLIVPILIWSFIWKGLALYKAARSEQKGWFVALLVLNTLGIVEIIYLLFFSNLPKHKISVKRKS